jgi:rRNA maturation endonuclease Nob1
MRTLVQPPPSSHCDLCGGELRLKKIESADRELDWEGEVLVCVNCGHELSCIVPHNHTAPHAKVA